MKTLTTLVVVFFITSLQAQHMSYAEFQKEARINKRLMPKYGQLPQSDDENLANLAFIEKSKEEYKTVQLASKAMVKKGYKALKKNPKEAMYSFNQAYLLDSTNADIYWGYGHLYNYFNQYALAESYYHEGLALNPKSTMLLNSIGENYSAMYSLDGNKDHLENGNKHLQTSFMVDPSKAETSRMLTLNYLELNNCEKAKKYYQVYLATEKKKEGLGLMERMEKECGLSQ